MCAKKAGNGPNKNDKGTTKNMADELRKTKLGKAAKRNRASQSPKQERRLRTASKKPVGAQTVPTKRKIVFRQWYTTNGVRRCQYTSGGKQCQHEARQAHLTCSAHSRLEQDVRETMLSPFGPDWMRRLKRDINNWFGKDLDFWTFFPKGTWSSGWKLIDFVLDELPNHREELYTVLEGCKEDIRPAIRLARTIVQGKFLLSSHEEAELDDYAAFLYKKWKQLEFFRIFGLNGINSSDIRSKPHMPGASVSPSDNRSRIDLKKVPRSIKPEGRAMFLEVMAVDAETQLFAAKKVKRDRFGKTALDREISELYHEIRSLEREITSSDAPRPLLSRKVTAMQARLDALVATRKSSENAKSELETRARELRAKQAELIGGQLEGTIINGRFVGPEKWYWKLSVLRTERSSGSKKRTGNRGKHASKKTSKKRSDKGTAGVGHCANVRGRFTGMTKEKDWDGIIADNALIAVSTPAPAISMNEPVQVQHSRPTSDVEAELVMTEVV